MEFIATFFDSIWAFFESIPAFLDDALVKLSAWYVIWITKAKIYFVGFSWQVARQVSDEIATIPCEITARLYEIGQREFEPRR